MANSKIKHLLALLVLLLTTRDVVAETFLGIENLKNEASLTDYQTAVISQLFLEKKNLMYCPTIGGTPNINVDAVVERSQDVEVENGQLIFTWSEATLFFDRLKVLVDLTADKKSIQDLKVEYYKYEKINTGTIEEPVLVNGYSLLGTCK